MMKKKISFNQNNHSDVTNKKYEKKLQSVRNDKIKKSLTELIKVFKEK